MKRRRDNQNIEEEEKEILTHKTRIDETENRVAKFIMSTEKEHSDFLRPWDQEFSHDQPISLSNQELAQAITMKERISLGFWIKPSLEDLSTLIDKESEKMKQIRQEDVINEEKKEKKKSEKSISKIKKGCGLDVCFEAIKLHQMKMSHKVICEKLNVNPNTLKH